MMEDRFECYIILDPSWIFKVALVAVFRLERMFGLPFNGKFAPAQLRALRLL